MESHRLSGSPDVRMQRGYMPPHCPRGSLDNLFGVRVQVQGIKGQPYVVLNSSGQESHKDISVITHQTGYNPGVVRRSVDGRQSPSEPQRTVNSLFHHQKHPETLRPYDPESNNFVTPFQTASAFGSRQPHTLPGAKPRIPLPAESPALDPAEVIQNETLPSGAHADAQSPNSVDTENIMSVGKLISQFNTNLRRGRGPRNRLDPEACRRSRSVDGSRIPDSSSSSCSSSRTSSVKGSGGETSGGVYPPGSARARLLGGQSTSNKVEESKPGALFRTQLCKEMVSQQAQKAEKPSAFRPRVNQTDDSEDREAQVNSSYSEQSSHLSSCIYVLLCFLTR